MNKESYKKLVSDLTPKEPRLKNAAVSFLVGGSLGLICQIFAYILVKSFGLSYQESYIWVCLVMIIIASFLTALGKFDNFVTKLKCGLIIPTTGFAHSVTSSALDYREDGLITGLGSNFFKLAGSVILYGIISSFFLVVLEVIIHG